MGTDAGVPARRLAAAAAAVLTMVGLAACTSGGKPAATHTTLPPAVGAMWAQTGPWVTVAPSDATYLPGPETPSSVRLEALIQRDSAAPATTVEKVPAAEDAAQTLYADPTAAEPWTDRAVMVGRVAASDVDGNFAPREGTTAVTIQGTNGRVGRYGDLWFAAWPIPVSSSTCMACDQQAFVIGHGLTKARVVAIARTVRQQPTPHAAAAALPAGLRSMGSVPGTQGDLWVGVRPQELIMRSGATHATFQVWSADPRLYAHLAFWSPDGKPVETWRRGWTRLVQQGDVTVVVSNAADSDPMASDVQALRAAAEALVPGDTAAVKAALADAVRNLEPLPSDQDLCDAAPEKPTAWTTLSSVLGGLRWGLTLQATDTGVAYCDDFFSVTVGAVTGGGGAGPWTPIPSGGIRLTGGGWTGVGDGPGVFMVAGDVPDSAVRVVVTAGEESTEAQLATVGPQAGRRWFAAAFLSDSLLNRADVTAYDEAGNAVATGRQG